MPGEPVPGYKHLTREQITKFTEAFNRMDLDGSGSVDGKELGTLMAFLGQETDADKIQAMIDEVDEDGSGEVEIDEFLIMMDKTIAEGAAVWMELMEGYKGCKEIFDEVDTDGSGALDRDEFRVLVRKLGKYLTKREMDEAMEQIDGDGSGSVEFPEFEHWWKNGGLKAPGFDELQDSQDPGLMELTIWLFRRDLAPYTRVFIEEGLRSMHDLYLLTKSEFLSLLMETIGVEQPLAVKAETDISIRRELLGYMDPDAGVGAGSQRSKEALQRKAAARRLKREGGRDWRNALGVQPEGSPTIRRAVHKPLPCGCFPAPLGSIKAAKMKARGRTGAGAVHTFPRQPLVSTQGRMLRPMGPQSLSETIQQQQQQQQLSPARRRRGRGGGTSRTDAPGTQSGSISTDSHDW